MGVSLGGGGISLGTGGTGLGALPFATRSTDSQPAIFTSTGARDTYYTTNPGDLVGDLAAGLEAVGIGPTDGDPVGVTAAFVRNNDNTGWNPIATNFVGETGPAGPAGTGINFGVLTPDTFVKTNSANNLLEPSSLTENGDQIDSTKMLLVPDAQGVMFGAIQVTNGGFNIVATTLDNRNFFPLASELTTPGSQRPNWIKLAGQTTTPSPANTSETFTGTSVQFKLINANTGLAERYTFNAAAIATDCNLIIRFTSHSGPEVFNFKRANGGTGFDLAVGENQVNLPGIGLFFRSNVELFVTIVPGSGNISLRGQTIEVGGTNETFPYTETLGRLSTDIGIFTDDSNEISSLTEKSSPVAADVIVIEDSADSFNKKKIQVNSLAATDSNDPDAIHDNVAGEINLIALKSTPVGDDIIVIEDSADSFNKKRITLSSLPDTSSTTPVGTDLRHGLSSQSDPALVTFSALTDVANPTNPQTIATGTATSGQYFHILNANTHPIQTITDTVLNQVVYTRGASSGNLFTYQANARTEASVTYNSLRIGPLNAGFDETYVLRF